MWWATPLGAVLRNVKAAKVAAGYDLKLNITETPVRHVERKGAVVLLEWHLPILLDKSSEPRTIQQ